MTSSLDIETDLKIVQPINSKALWHTLLTANPPSLSIILTALLHTPVHLPTLAPALARPLVPAVGMTISASAVTRWGLPFRTSANHKHYGISGDNSIA